MAVRFNHIRPPTARDMKARVTLRIAFAPTARDMKAGMTLRIAFAPTARDMKARGKREARRPW